MKLNLLSELISNKIVNNIINIFTIEQLEQKNIYKLCTTFTNMYLTAEKLEATETKKVLLINLVHAKINIYIYG